MSQEIYTNLEQLKRIFFDLRTLREFIGFLMNKSSVIAPQRKGKHSFSYQPVRNSKDVVLDYPRTIQPLKKFFLPPRETLLSFDLHTNAFKSAAIDSSQKIFFGIHAYEMQGLLRLDYAFREGHPEWNYFARRDNSVFIGVSFTPDEYHFSKSVGIEIEKLEGFSLYIEPVDSGYLVFIIDETGKSLIDEFGKGRSIDSELQFEVIEKHFKTKIKYHHNRLPQVFDGVYRSQVWGEIAQRCLGCGTCNLLCPTCYCFDVKDEVDLNVRDGKRERFWDGCMLNSFALVAGGENFRDPLSSRTRHRMHRKFKYLTENSGELHCVGCGRCSRYCPAEINIIEIVNDLIEDFSSQQKKMAI